MTFNLSIQSDTLDLEAPLLGRWFCAANPNPNADGGGALTPAQLNLPAITAGGDFGLTFTPPANTAWLPPALGSLGLFVVGAGTPPPQLAHLRNAAGSFPFTTSTVVAHFTLLPAVAERLFQLTRFVPAINVAPTAAAGTAYGGDPAPTRVKVASFTVELPANSTQLNILWAMIPQIDNPGQFDTPAKQASFLGLTVSNNIVASGPSPMCWLRRPGYFTAPVVLDPREDRLLLLPSAQCRLWAFDDRGRPIDPGAVAAWWSTLAMSMIAPANTMRAPGFNDPQGTWPTDATGATVVCAAAAGVSVQLVNAHEGPLGAPFIGGANRLTGGGAAVSSNVLVSNAATGAITLGVTAAPAAGADPNNPTPDTAPQPRLALLPNGAYAVAPLTLWPGPAGGGTGTAGDSRLTDYAPLARDFARIAVMDIERHLVGLDRIASNQPPPAGTPDRNVRRADQNRVSTRVNVGAVTSAPGTPVLLSDADMVAAAAMTLVATQPAGSRRTRMVAPAADAQWGTSPLWPPIPAGAPAASVAFPAALAEGPAAPAALAVDQYRVSTLAGDGSQVQDNGQTIIGQMVFVEVQLPAVLAGAWVRAWPLGFELETALHRRMFGGSGLVDPTGRARLVMALPDDQNNDAAPCGFDMTISFLAAAGGPTTRRSYGDLRFRRPAPAPGTPPVTITIATTSTVHICEAGIRLVQPAPGAATPYAVVPPGATVVEEIGGAFTLVDRTTIPTAGGELVHGAGPAPLQPQVIGNLLGTVLPTSISLTQPAYTQEFDRVDAVGRPVATAGPGPDPRGGLNNVLVATVDRIARTEAEAGVRASYPFRGCERLEVALTHDDPTGNVALGVIGSVPCLPRYQEQGPHHLGHPGAATADVCGTGVALTGPAAVPLLEYTYERTAGVGMLAGVPQVAQWALHQSEWLVLAEAAVASQPSVVTGGAVTAPTPWAAVLRTVSPHMEGVPGLDIFFDKMSIHSSQDQFNNFINNTLVPTVNNISAGTGTTIGAAISTSGTVQFMGRALDQRLRAKLRGARDTAYSLDDAIARAEDFIYIETPALDSLDHGPGGDPLDRIDIWDRLMTRLAARPALHVILCVSTRLMPGTPAGLQSLRDALLLEAIGALRGAHGDRVAVFCPGAGGDRPLYLASTTVVIDDVYAVTGTSHLWRRGQSFDSSIACAVFDENVTNNRCTEVRRFRTTLMARRLGVPVTMLPDDPVALTRAVRELDQRGSERLAGIPIRAPTPPSNINGYPTDSDKNIWNPDGSNTSQTIDEMIEDLLANIGFAPSFTDGNPNDGTP